MQSSRSTSADSAKPSGRKGSRKARTGCITCKLRKVKCDEGKPLCARCIKTGRKCDGYLPPKRPQSNRLALSLSPSPEFESSDEFRAFDYYRSCSAPFLGSVVDGEFWGGSVLRLSLTEPAVRHAVLALSSLHEHINSDGGMARDAGMNFAFLEYGKAMTAMRTWDSRGEPAAIPLLVCVLFTCIEFLLDHKTSSQLHIGQGRQILSGLEEGVQSPSMALIKEELVPIYTRLSLASYLFARCPAGIPEHLQTVSSPPAEFKSLHEARNCLYHLLDISLSFSSRARLAIYSQALTPEDSEAMKATQQQLLSSLNKWDAAFTVTSLTQRLNTAWIATQQLLKMYYHTATVWVATVLDPLELAYDAHLPAYASILSHASSYLNLQQTEPTAHAFSFETEVMAPVYWVAIKCRHPMLRRSALNILKRGELRERKENLWYGREVIAMALRVLELEEEDSDFEEAGFARTHNELDILDLRKLELYDGELSVPSSDPPRLYPTPLNIPEMPLDRMAQVFPECDEVNYDPRLEPGPRTPPFIEPLPPQLGEPRIDETATESPFNVPESKRVKNAVFGPRKGDSIWVTLFLDPAPGQLEWTVKRELLSI